MAARREIHYLDLYQHVSGVCARELLRIRGLLLCCDVLLAVSEDVADDELEEVAILTGKPRPPGSTTPGVRQYFVSVT